MTEIGTLVGRDEWDIANNDGRPYVVYKFAASLDGRIAASDGTSQWITGEQSRAEVHRLRAELGCVVVGSGTQQADNPHLAVRLPQPTTQPVRVVIDSNARTPRDARILDDTARTVLAVAPDADAAHLDGAAEVIRAPRTNAGLDVHAVLKQLHERGISALLLEGGPTLAGSFIAARLVDRVIAYVAPVLLGAGKAALNDAGIHTIADAQRLTVHDVCVSGPDVRITATTTPARHGAP